MGLWESSRLCHYILTECVHKSSALYVNVKFKEKFLLQLDFKRHSSNIKWPLFIAIKNKQIDKQSTLSTTTFFHLGYLRVCYNSTQYMRIFWLSCMNLDLGRIIALHLRMYQHSQKHWYCFSRGEVVSMLRNLSFAQQQGQNIQENLNKQIKGLG